MRTSPNCERKCSPHSHLAGPNYLMFNNIYSKEDALRFLSLNC